MTVNARTCGRPAHVDATEARTVLAASLPVRPRASSTRRNSAMPGPAASG